MTKATRPFRTGVTREQLLAPAQETPGARLGIRVAVIVLLLGAYRPTFVGRLFGPTRMTLTRWVDRLNREGRRRVLEKPRPGRATSLTSRLRQQLSEDLDQSPEKYGLPRVVWDGPTLAADLRRHFAIHVKVRQAQNWLHRLGYRLKRVGDGETFRKRLKKTSPPDEKRGRGV